MTTVGTDIFQIVFTAGYAAISQYAIYGFIFYTLAMGMLLAVARETTPQPGRKR